MRNPRYTVNTLMAKPSVGLPARSGVCDGDEVIAECASLKNAAKIAKALNGGVFDLRHVSKMVSGTSYPHNMPSLFAIMDDGSMWVTTIVVSGSAGGDTATAAWQRVDMTVKEG